MVFVVLLALKRTFAEVTGKEQSSVRFALMVMFVPITNLWEFCGLKMERLMSAWTVTLNCDVLISA